MLPECYRATCCQRSHIAGEVRYMLSGKKIQGCDASILLNSTANNTAEKDAVPNQTLSRFDVIDVIKAEVEKKCPNVVSCADVLALVARDAVEETARCREYPRCWLIFLPLPQISPPSSEISQTTASMSVTWWSYQVLLIRKHNDVGNDLQSANGKFNVGAHTIGVGHCNAFSNRLYNFTGKGDQDPSLNATYAAFLKTQCQSLSDNTTFVPMDPISVLAFDSNYYVTLKQNRGLFQSDAALLTNNGSSNIVNQLLNQNKFFAEFARSIKKMGAIGVLTGNAGEIRKQCFVVN